MSQHASAEVALNLACFPVAVKVSAPPAAAEKAQSVRAAQVACRRGRPTEFSGRHVQQMGSLAGNQASRHSDEHSGGVPEQLRVPARPGSSGHCVRALTVKERVALTGQRLAAAQEEWSSVSASRDEQCGHAGWIARRIQARMEAMPGHELGS